MLRKCLNVFLWMLVPLIVIASVWAPIILHNYVPQVQTVTDNDVAIARSQPVNTLLEEISTYDFYIFGERAITTIRSQDKILQVADKIIQGVIELPNQPKIIVSPKFNTGDLEQGTLHQQLRLASFVYQQILLLAYEVSGNEKYFAAAKEYIFVSITYEQTVLIPTGFLWNDHALAGKAIVLVKFWNIYRNHTSYISEEAQLYLQYVVQTAARLVDAKQFTFATNHGVMQNLALLHLGVAFPTIKELQSYSDIASNRLEKQFEFYINEEGIVLEHSAEYHEMGVELLGLALRYYDLLHKNSPKEWLHKYAKSQQAFSAMRRIDGSLPRWGDTAELHDEQDPALLEFDIQGKIKGFNNNYFVTPPSSNSIYPAAGVSIWWNGLNKWPDIESLSQTFFTWSYYPGLGHKHADELSFLIWAEGERWWTNAGYWPYDDSYGRNQMTSWAGSNAPHLSGEAADSDRNSQLRGHRWTSQLAFIDAERLGPGDFSIRRQLLHIKPNVWVCLDSYSDSNKQTVRTIWTTSNDIKVETKSINNTYELFGNNGSPSMTVHFVESDQNAKHTKFSGSKDPFLGWVQSKGDVHPATSLMFERSSTSKWSIAISMLNHANAQTLTTTAKMDRWIAPTAWKLTVPTNGGDIWIERDGDKLTSSLLSNDKHKVSVNIKTVPNASQSVANVNTALAGLANKYANSFRELGYYRLKATYWLLGLLVLQEIFFLLLRLLCKGCPGFVIVGLRTVSSVGWLAIGWWLFNVYFK